MASWHSLVWVSVLCWAAVACSPTAEPPPSQPQSPPATEPQPSTENPELPPDDTDSQATDPEGVGLLQDTTIIPGERVGPVTRQTSRADLVEIFGESALEDADIPVGEGFTEAGTVIHGGTRHAVSVIWSDSDRSGPATARDFGADWQTPEGIRVGTPFEDLKTLLGNFELYGFGWDYGGTVVLERSNLSHYDGWLILRLQPDPTTLQPQSAAFQAVQGDTLLSSEDPYLSTLNLSVYEMVVYLNPPQD